IQQVNDNDIIKYASVTAAALNVRESHSASSKKASDRDPVIFGAILRIYEIKDGWYKISKSASHWVASKYTVDVKRYVVKATTLNVRSGPSTSFPKVGQIYKNDQVFIEENRNNWARIVSENSWVNMSYLKEFGF
ncbi:MAG TPA: SH3 domain-containing protein, partial [Saprospiraceae bacterium]|nr:SH3 domain-containing protein [Saprospiraceae bacterium]